MSVKKYLSLIFLVTLTACIQCPASKTYTISQVGSYSKLMQGDYRGKIPLGEVRKYGDFGVGTYDSLDGEMIALNGKFYQATSNGKVKIAKNIQTIPYASVHFFRPDNTLYLEGPLDFKALTETIDRIRTNQDKIFGLKITGNFSYLKLRSPKIQSKPYKKLKDIIEKQPFFEHKDIEGTLVGYYTPEKFGITLIPGYHFHFISKDERVGGHVLELNLTEAKFQFDQIDFDNLNLLEE